MNTSGNGLPVSRDGVTKSVMSLTDANDFLVVLASGTVAGVATPATTNPGVYRTTNGGTNFTQVQNLPSGLNTSHRYDPQSCFIERDATDNNVRYFASRGLRFQKSTNGGTNWAPTANDPFPNNSVFDYTWSLCADPVRTGNLWAAGGYRGLRVLRNGGDTWTEPGLDIESKFVSSYDGKIAAFGTALGDLQPRLYYSIDDGVTFTALTDATP